MKLSQLIVLAVVAFSLSSIAQGQKLPTFSQYKSATDKKRVITVDLKSHKDARMFRTNLRNAAKGGVNFAGHYVLTGGELAAAIISDAVIRLVPGVISDEQSALSDCFQDDILSAPIYTRPSDYKGWKVPEILLSGNEAKIRQWEFDQAMERTKRLRPDLLEE